MILNGVMVTQTVIGHANSHKPGAVEAVYNQIKFKTNTLISSRTKTCINALFKNISKVRYNIPNVKELDQAHCLFFFSIERPVYIKID